MATQPAQIRTLTLQIMIDAAPAAVWQGLTDDIGRWWPADFYSGGEPGQRGFTLDAAPGGQMVETWDNGGGVLWGTVVAMDPQQSLRVLGHLFPGWGGPSQWYGSWTLQAAGKQTQLEFSETSMGLLSDDGLEETTKGWEYLWRNLKAHVEGQPAPAWPS